MPVAWMRLGDVIHLLSITLMFLQYDCSGTPTWKRMPIQASVARIQADDMFDSSAVVVDGDQAQAMDCR